MSPYRLTFTVVAGVLGAIAACGRAAPPSVTQTTSIVLASQAGTPPLPAEPERRTTLPSMARPKRRPLRVLPLRGIRQAGHVQGQKGSQTLLHRRDRARRRGLRSALEQEVLDRRHPDLPSERGASLHDQRVAVCVRGRRDAPLRVRLGTRQ